MCGFYEVYEIFKIFILVSLTLTCVFVFSSAAGHGMIDQLEDAIRYVGSLPNRIRIPECKAIIQ
jgi:hypothetical protein